MKLLSLFKSIESIEFAAQMGVASGLGVFRRALDEHNTIRQLIGDVEKTPAHKQKVVERVTTLLSNEGVPDVDHPHDAALAGYLFALSKTDSSLAYSVAVKFEQTPNLWWAKRLATAILETMQTASIEEQPPR